MEKCQSKEATTLSGRVINSILKLDLHLQVKNLSIWSALVAELRYVS